MKFSVTRVPVLCAALIGIGLGYLSGPASAYTFERRIYVDREPDYIYPNYPGRVVYTDEWCPNGAVYQAYPDRVVYRDRYRTRYYRDESGIETVGKATIGLGGKAVKETLRAIF